MHFSTILSALSLISLGLAQSNAQQPLPRLPPACLLHAVNTQDEPGDLSAVCGNKAKDVQSAIAALCDDNVASVAQAAFVATCSSDGKSVAAYTPTSSRASKTTAVVVQTTDANGNAVTTTVAGANETNAAAVQKVGVTVVVVAVVAIAAAL